MHVSWNSQDPGCREPLVRPWVGVKQKVQTSDPDLVTQLSKEEPADPSVMTAAQGSSAPARRCRDNGSFVGKGRCGGCSVSGRRPWSVLLDLRREMLRGKG